jgi:hypothetical protein
MSVRRPVIHYIIGCSDIRTAIILTGITLITGRSSMEVMYQAHRVADFMKEVLCTLLNRHIILILKILLIKTPHPDVPLVSDVTRVTAHNGDIPADKDRQGLVFLPVAE